jgi:hypothetical protein
MIDIEFASSDWLFPILLHLFPCTFVNLWKYICIMKSYKWEGWVQAFIF